MDGLDEHLRCSKTHFKMTGLFSKWMDPIGNLNLITPIFNSDHFADPPIQFDKQLFKLAGS